MHFFRYIFSQKSLRISFAWVVLAIIACSNYTLNLNIARGQIALTRAEAESRVIEMDTLEYRLAELKQGDSKTIRTFRRLELEEVQQFETQFREIAKEYAVDPELKNVRYSTGKENPFVEYQLKVSSDLPRILDYAQQIELLPYNFDVVESSLKQNGESYEHTLTLHLFIESL